MPAVIHAFSQEEIMAYLDGELSADRALLVSQHTVTCRECQHLAESFQNVSRCLVDWQVERTSSAVPQITVGVRKRSNFVFWKRPLLGTACVAAALFLISLLPTHPQLPLKQPVVEDETEVHYPGAPPARMLMTPRELKIPGMMAQGAGGGAGREPSTVSAGPLIVRTTHLALVSKNLDLTESRVEGITKTHGGYIAQMELNTPAGAGRLLNATLRAPAAQLDVMLQELRGLGKVEEESQNAEDVTQHSVDLSARLANLRTTEERLLQLLRERAGRLADVLQVEEAVDRTRGEIEVAEAEQKMLSKQIALATVNLRISEEYKAALDRGETSTVTRLRNAAIEGYRNVLDGTVGLLEFLLSVGPALVIVLAIAFYPARWMRRKWEGRRSGYA